MTKVRQLRFSKNLSSERNGYGPAPTSYSRLDDLLLVDASNYTADSKLSAVITYLVSPPILQTKKLLTDSTTWPRLLSSVTK